MTDDEREQLNELRREMDLHSLGDRPSSIAAHKLRRLIELEAQEAAECRMPMVETVDE
jgi:hypothetical protein